MTNLESAVADYSLRYHRNYICETDAVFQYNEACIEPYAVAASHSREPRNISLITVMNMLWEQLLKHKMGQVFWDQVELLPKFWTSCLQFQRSSRFSYYFVNFSKAKIIHSPFDINDSSYIAAIDRLL
jgi:hypothetical protein